MLPLSNPQIKFLRTKAHSLKVVVIISSNGLTENVLAAIDEALEFHELIKIKLRSEDRQQKAQLVNAICQKAKAAKIQLIGNVLICYRAAKEAKLVIPGPKSRK